MKKSIWFMEGLSSQRDIISQIIAHFGGEKAERAIGIVASHRHDRADILAVADHSYIEPKGCDDLLAFMQKIINKHRVIAIHASNRRHLLEQHRATIEAMGVKLITGATSLASLQLADDKVAFAERMSLLDLPIVPSIRVTSAEHLKDLLARKPFDEQIPCIKPVEGIYGQGFWILDKEVKASSCFANPDNRFVHPDVYLAAVEQHWPEEMVLMPYLPGEEYSVDMLMEKGRVLMAVGRCKDGTNQTLHISGEAVELAKRCAAAMGADGLVNVQTKVDSQGKALLLEINTRPSGGIGYGLHSNIDLASAFALHMMGLLDQAKIDRMMSRFQPTELRIYSATMPLEKNHSSYAAAGVM